MPLRAAHPLPIKAPRGRAAGAAAATAATAAAAVTPVMLNVPYIKQEQNQWCWAACAQMVAEFLGKPTVKQCELANFLHGQTRCCQNPTSPACNKPSPYAGIGPVYAHLQINCISHTWPVNAQVLLQELTAQRPVEVGLLWLGGGGHVVVVRGVTAQGYFALHDPWYGTGLSTYLNLYNAYGRGQWAYTFGDFRNL